ncbi:MAG: hypothetical protein JWM95_3820 [Gemmatimonadetes bacterium]|nr:hypothetical protein [Gemmatimonadota bacterium]
MLANASPGAFKFGPDQDDTHHITPLASSTAMFTKLMAPLFRRRTPQPPASSVTSTPVAAAAIAESDVPPEIPAVAEPPVDPLVEWQEEFTRRLGRWREAAGELRSTPDAAALIELLGQSSEFVIRQLPAAAREAIAYCDEANISRAHLAGRLGRDPALVQSLLRTANSAAMSAGRQPVLGLNGAIERIGVTSTRTVVLANCVDGLLSRPGYPYETMVGSVWEHMIRTGQIARTTAGAFEVDQEEAFSVALLHDVGKLVVFDQLSALRNQLRRPVIVPVAWLGALLQGVHEPLGALASLRWSMGARAAAAIGEHHRYRVDVGENMLAECIFTSERADHANRRGEPIDIDAVFQSGRLSGSRIRASQALEKISSAA